MNEDDHTLEESVTNNCTIVSQQSVCKNVSFISDTCMNILKLLFTLNIFVA